jgi:hypothetical protein
VPEAVVAHAVRPSGRWMPPWFSTAPAPGHCAGLKVAAVLGGLLRMGFVRSSDGGRSFALRRAA